MIKKYKTKEVIDFLRESNAIEQVYDDDSLKQAKFAWDYLSKEKELNHHVILKTHKILMLHQLNLRPDEKGYYRRVPVSVGNKHNIRWENIEVLLDSWLEDIKVSVKIPGEEGKNIEIDHITYEGIHPFVDGNGRTGRMFMNWERMQAGLPILIIHADWPKIGGEQMSYYSLFK